jgi:hypothetical protein
MNHHILNSDKNDAAARSLPVFSIPVMLVSIQKWEIEKSLTPSPRYYKEV